MNPQEAEIFINASVWIFAKSMPQYPHWYVLRSNCKESEFISFVQYIRDNGYPKYFKHHRYIYLDIGEYTYWTMGNTMDKTILINRTLIHSPGAT